MHRDLKPENIMFRYHSFSNAETYEPVIVDFGLAANCDIVPYLFFRCGTPGFVAPEIIKTQQHEKYTSACDMFSVGCIFHLLLANQPLFPGTKYE
jgi:calcium-dependent protein kinase